MKNKTEVLDKRRIKLEGMGEVGHMRMTTVFRKAKIWAIKTEEKLGC